MKIFHICRQEGQAADGEVEGCIMSSGSGGSLSEEEPGISAALIDGTPGR